MKPDEAKRPVRAKEEQTTPANPSILGTFEGECADANITNLNGLDITAPVWENVFNSEDFKKAIKLGHYIGFLGHPDDVGDQDFRNGCIVMTEGHIDSDGKVYGKFNLLNTPVGRIVKTFIDAGVTFGISVRGAGDIVENSVDPETFVFRGFDLVTFPAYPNSIPTFTELAASTDVEKQKNYRAICASVNANVDDVVSVEALKIMQSQFAPQSDEYKKIAARIEVLSGEGCKGCKDKPEDEQNELYDTRLQAVTALYAESVSANKKLKEENARLRRSNAELISATTRKVKAIRRINASQMHDMKERITSAENRYQTVQASLKKLKSSEEITATENLKYRQEAESQIREQRRTIASLQKKLDETVIKASTAESRASNLGAKVENLTSQNKEILASLESYQIAYADMLATAIGVHIPDMPISASTSVEEMKQMIRGRSASFQSNVKATQTVQSVEPVDIVAKDESGLVTV